MYIDFFFFSSRRRHTRLQGDWSSDVCSSDLMKDVPAQDALRPQLAAFVEKLDAMKKKRSEEHTSELQSPCNLVCRLLLEKKKKICLLERPSNNLLICLLDAGELQSKYAPFRT